MIKTPTPEDVKSAYAELAALFRYRAKKNHETLLALMLMCAEFPGFYIPLQVIRDRLSFLRGKDIGSELLESTLAILCTNGLVEHTQVESGPAYRVSKSSGFARALTISSLIIHKKETDDIEICSNNKSLEIKANYVCDNDINLELNTEKKKKDTYAGASNPRAFKYAFNPRVRSVRVELPDSDSGDDESPNTLAEAVVELPQVQLPLGKELDNAKALPDAKGVVEHLVDLWRRRSGRKTARVTPARAGMITARFREGYSLEELRMSIAGHCYSPYHREHGYDTIELALRSGERIEKGVRLWQLYAPIEFVETYQRQTGTPITVRAEELAEREKQRVTEKEMAERLERTRLEREAEEQARLETARMEQELVDAILNDPEYQ
jgi:hypothetical protein